METSVDAGFVAVGVVDVGLSAVAVLCFAGAAVLAAAEVSLIRVRRSQVEVEADAGDRRSQQLLRLLDDLPVVLNTVLLLVLFCQVGLVTIGGFLAQRWVGGVGVTIGSFLLTLGLFVYAEAVPKTNAIRAPNRLARRVTPSIRMLVLVFRPLVGLLVGLADLQARGGGAETGPPTEDELRILARQSAEAGTIETSDAVLVDRSFTFGDLRAADVMVPRDQIAAVGDDRSVARFVADAIASGHRRLPVLQDNDLDRVIGVVRLRDAVAASGRSPRVPSSEVMAEVLRCPPTEQIADLLRRMQTTGMWLAIVTDGANRTLGLVTIEDVVAELVGEIEDNRKAVDAS